MLKAAAKAVVTMGIATKKDPECVRVVVRSVSGVRNLLLPCHCPSLSLCEHGEPLACRRPERTRC